MSPAGGALNSIVMRHRNRRAKAVVAASMAVMLTSPMLGRADSWAFPATKTEEARTFGSIRIVVTVDARQNQKYPLTWVDVFNKQTLLARYPEFPADAVHASEDAEYFLLLSNSGLTRLAYAVLDRNGRLLMSAAHGRPLRYCAESVSLVREWYDRDHPTVRFKIAKETSSSEGPPVTFLEAVLIRGCSGQDVKIAVPRQ